MRTDPVDLTVDVPTDLRHIGVDHCLRLLEEQHFGRLAFDDAEGPMVLPVNYVFAQGTVVFRSDLGTKLAAAEGRDLAAFEIDHVDEVNRVGWSVVVRGRLQEVVDPDELEELAQLDVTPFTTGDGKQHYVRLLPRTISGRLTPIPEKVPAGWFRAAVLGTDVIAHLD